jgi:hypothetical protein
MLVPPQVVEVAAMPLKVAMLVPCVLPKFVPVIVTHVPIGPELGETPLMPGIIPVGSVVFAACACPAPAGETTPTHPLRYKFNPIMKKRSAKVVVFPQEFPLAASCKRIRILPIELKKKQPVELLSPMCWEGLLTVCDPNVLLLRRDTGRPNRFRPSRFPLLVQAV